MCLKTLGSRARSCEALLSLADSECSSCQCRSTSSAQKQPEGFELVFTLLACWPAQCSPKRKLSDSRHSHPRSASTPCKHLLRASSAKVYACPGTRRKWYSRRTRSLDSHAVPVSCTFWSSLMRMDAEPSMATVTITTPKPSCIGSSRCGFKKALPLCRFGWAAMRQSFVRTGAYLGGSTWRSCSMSRSRVLSREDESSAGERSKLARRLALRSRSASSPVYSSIDCPAAKCVSLMS
mmetsp:Transcript_16849/g.27951  ORF Transcript_16849/g.27951 Transcript_16849/m.27951 type:complete len:237 (-) Transcript_16849:402-1112(-)